MSTTSAAVRLIALVLVVVLTVVLTTPAKAEADPLAIAGLVSLAIAGVILVAYLIVANVSDSGTAAEETRVVWVASALTVPDPQSP